MSSFQNNGKLKLLIIVGTRPEIIRLAAVIKKCRKYFDTILAHTGQNYDYNLNGVFFRDLQLADPEVYMDAVGETLGQTMGNIIAKSYDLMVELQPDAVLVLGDTNSCLSVIGAKRLHIPIFHMEAGNRCKDECLPEETNRRIVDIISDVNLCYSEHARRYLADDIVNFGVELLHYLCSASHSRSFNCGMLYPVTDEMKSAGIPSGRCVRISAINCSSSMSLFVTASNRCLSSNSGLYCVNSPSRISYSRRISSASAGTMNNSTELRSIWRRKRSPSPRPSCAPSMIPGMSAMTNDLPSRHSTIPRLGSSVVKA